MTYPEAISFLFSSLPVWEQKGAEAYKPGLERITEFTQALGDPQKKFVAVHVAGTNGKGSVSSMLAAVLQSAGYRTGLFTSPHLVDFRERIRVDGQMIPEEAVVEFTEQWKDTMTGPGLSFFEMTTAMGFWWFERSGCRVAIIEAGLGGRLDSTNIITPAVSVITNIGLEHTKFLGDTIAAIAGEKAGIIKAGIPVVVGETDAESEAVFRARAMSMGSEIVFADSVPAPDDYRLDLGGGYQHKNLRTVLATVNLLRRRFDVGEDAVREGIAHAAKLTGLRGRWDVLKNEPTVVCDTAHNAHGFAETVRQIERERQKYDNLYMVLGFASDKDLDAIIPLLPADAHYVLTQAKAGRAMATEELARRFATHGIVPSKCVDSVPEAVEYALSVASPRDIIYIGGSNFVVGEALESFNC